MEKTVRVAFPIGGGDKVVQGGLQRGILLLLLLLLLFLLLLLLLSHVILFPSSVVCLCECGQVYSYPRCHSQAVCAHVVERRRPSDLIVQGRERQSVLDVALRALHAEAADAAGGIGAQAGVVEAEGTRGRGRGSTQREGRSGDADGRARVHHCNTLSQHLLGLVQYALIGCMRRLQAVHPKSGDEHALSAIGEGHSRGGAERRMLLKLGEGGQAAL
jgi:hypothetical protein